MKIKNKPKLIGYILGIVLFIALIGGITYAAFNWRSTNTNISVNTKCFDIEGNSSYTVNGSNMLFFDENDIIDTTNNTITYKNGMIYYPFNITRGSDCNTDVYYEIIVNVTSLSEDYRNGSLKYKIIDDMSSYTSEKIANPLNEDLEYNEMFEGSIINIGTYTIFAKNVSLNTNIIPAVIFYLDGDLVPENASNFAFAASIEVVGNQGNYTADSYITYLYTKAEKSTATVNNITYNLAPSVELMNDRLASMSTDINGGNIRYYGANPNNYVWLGDTYTSKYTFTSNGASITRNVGDKKLWRVIGVFDGKVKLIQNDPIRSTSNLSWDTSESTVNNGYGINQWGESTYSDTGEVYPGADLMRLLNPGYEEENINNSLYWNKGTGTVYTGRSNATTSNVSFANTGLSSVEKNMIDTATWYLGGFNSNDVHSNIAYTIERGTDHVANPSDGVTRQNTWTGKVGLMYPSDYGYATDLTTCSNSMSGYNVVYANLHSCKYQDWLYDSSYVQCTLSPFFDSSMCGAINNGALSSYRASGTYAYVVRPVIYLKFGVTISSGTGTESDPYVLSYSE